MIRDIYTTSDYFLLTFFTLVLVFAEDLLVFFTDDALFFAGDFILDGDLVIVKRSETANNGDTVVAYVNNEATLKELYIANKSIQLHPKNSDFEVIKIDKKDDFRIGGIVLGVIRKY